MPILFVTVLIDLIGFGIIIPILPFMAPPLGASNLDIALIIAIYSVCGGLAGPYWGRLSDRIGRKPVMLICLAGAAVSYVLLAFSHTLLMLYVARALAGLMAGNFGVASAMVADLCKPEDRARNMGMIGAAFGLGMVVGPFLGGILSGSDGDFLLPGLFAAGLSTTALIAASLWLRESLPVETRAEHAAHRQQHGNGGSTWRMLREHRNTLLAAQYFLTNSSHTIVSYLFPLWVGAYLGWGAREVGMVFGVQGVAMALLQGGLIGRLVRLLGDARVLLLAAVMIGTGFAIAANSTSDVHILLAFFTAVTGGTLCTPVLNAMTANRSPGHLRGRMLGTTSSSAAFGRVFGPLLGGLMLSAFGFNLAWLSGMVLAFLMGSWALSQILQPTPVAESLIPAPDFIAPTKGSHDVG